MKMIVGALALALAVPAAAQTAPAAAPDPHAQHKGMDHGKHGQGTHDRKDCCDKMKQSGGKMECMDQKSEAKPAPSASGGHDVHQGHAH